MSVINLFEQFHLLSYKDLRQLLENLVNESQAVWDRTVGNGPFCEAVSCSSQLEMLVCMLVWSERTHKEERKGDKVCFISILSLSEINSMEYQK